MTAPAKHSFAHASRLPCLLTFFSRVLLFLAVTCPSTIAQSASEVASVRGTVLNRITREPISRALVFTADQQYATLTDDRGHFEFKFLPRRESEPRDNQAIANSIGPIHDINPQLFSARKPGFLDAVADPSLGFSSPNRSEITLYLDPESLIVGLVSIPGAEGDIRIRLELFRQEASEGREHWVSAGSLTTWSDGRFRFSNLSRGTYKLFTHDQRDPDPAFFSPDVFGFPPVFYPGASDLSAATPIHLATGATFQANLSVTRRQYYPVKIPVANLPAGQAVDIRVYPLGHPGPGYSLAYNRAEEQIQGTLPDGSYTLQADAQGQPGLSGILSFSVHGQSLQMPPLSLLPNSSMTVSVREEFGSGQSAFGSEEPVGGSPANSLRRAPDVRVTLTTSEEFGLEGTAISQPLEGNQDHALIIPNVRPGRYRVHAESGIGYVASIQSGGTDLLREPLEVGVSGSSSPIELRLRDDGASAIGTVEDAGNPVQIRTHSNEDREAYIYFLPLNGSSGQFREVTGAADGTFEEEQVPPGIYLVLAFARQHDELAYASQEALHNLEPRGQVLRLSAGQKERLRLRIAQEADSQ